MASVRLFITGFCRFDVNPLGPVQINVAPGISFANKFNVSPGVSQKSPLLLGLGMGGHCEKAE
jgi:hypothetical protein